MQIERIVDEYRSRVPRESIDVVSELRQAAGERPSLARRAAVVGTNGKTSAATYLQRLLTASGLATGLYVSPHLSDWTERISVDGQPCERGELERTLQALHERAQAIGAGEDLRFFDLLTLAAERIFHDRGVSAAVFEAGVGGRLDAVRVLRPDLVLLTSVAVDHAEILGETLAEILVEKLLAAPPGATVISHRLGPELEDLAIRVSADVGFRIEWLAGEEGGWGDGAATALPGYLRRALSLAIAAWRLMLAPPVGSGEAPPVGAINLAVAGRFQHGRHDRVPYLLDSAHNEAAWLALGAELRARPVSGREPVTVLFSVSPGKRRGRLGAAILAIPGFGEAIITRHTMLAAADPGTVAAELRQEGVEATGVDDVADAIREAFERARRSGGSVLVFGSTHLVGEVQRHLS